MTRTLMADLDTNEVEPVPTWPEIFKRELAIWWSHVAIWVWIVLAGLAFTGIIYGYILWFRTGARVIPIATILILIAVGGGTLSYIDDRSYR